MSTLCRIYRIYVGSLDSLAGEKNQVSSKTKESGKPDIGRIGTGTGSEKDADCGRTDRNSVTDGINRNHGSGQDMSGRRTDRNSAGFTNKEISCIGYEFLLCAALDFISKDDGNSVRRSAEDRNGFDANKPKTDPEGLDFEIARGEYGKPYFLHHPELHFNISNSGDWILMALSGVNVGIDIQMMTDIPLKRIGKRVFAPDEYESFLKMDEQRDYFFREWVLRESYIKWTGEGLGRDMRSLPDDAWQALIPAPDGYKAAITAAVPLVCVDTEVQYDRQKGFIWTK